MNPNTGTTRILPCPAPEMTVWDGGEECSLLPRTEQRLHGERPRRQKGPASEPSAPALPTARLQFRPRGSADRQKDSGIPSDRTTSVGAAPRSHRGATHARPRTEAQPPPRQVFPGRGWARLAPPPRAGSGCVLKGEGCPTSLPTPAEGSPATGVRLRAHPRADPAPARPSAGRGEKCGPGPEPGGAARLGEARAPAAAPALPT